MQVKFYFLIFLIIINFKFPKIDTDSNEILRNDDREALVDLSPPESPRNNAHLPHPPNLTEIRALNTFTSQTEAFHWYLNLITDTMFNCIKCDTGIQGDEKQKRSSIVTAHLLYARNFYELKIKNSSHLKTTPNLLNIHPCLIALACLLDSDSVRVVESHGCACDTYLYLFSTRLKFCAWKCKLYIILKKPKRSSIDRLSLIEDLTNCHKIIQRN
jgi:hypothetical protein